MSVGEPQVQHLLERLEAESGMRNKVRLLASSWSLLQQLSPQQRERVALAVGNRWAWRNIESLFGNPKKLSPNQLQVKSLFDSLRDADPDKLREVGKEIKEGGIAGVQSRVVGAVQEALDEQIADEDESPEPAEPAPEPLPEEPVERPSVEPPVAESTGSAPEESSSDQTEAGREPEREAEPEPRPEPQPEPEPALESESAGSAEEPTPEVDTPFGDYHPDATALSAVESLRVLRRLSSGQVSSTRAGRAAMIGSLGSGWAARRAVSSIIRSRSAATLDEALALIRQLPTATQQIWCLGDVIQYWDLDDNERSRVLAAAPTDSARRRLAQRSRLAVDHPL